MKNFSRTIPGITAIVLVCMGLLFTLYAALILMGPWRFISPDENANMVFASLYAQSGRLHILEEANLYVDHIVMPRSMTVVDGLVVPGGFLGVPMIYGLIGSLLGTSSILFITPILAVLGVGAWGLLLRHAFGTRIAIFGAILLAFHPVWWYWSMRTMMPNIPFVSLLIMSAWVYCAAPLKHLVDKHTESGGRLLRHLDGPIAGTLLGLALAIRTSEVLWIAIAMIATLCVVKQRPWTRIVTTAVFATLVMSIFALSGLSLYGSIFPGGYSVSTAGAIGIPTGGLGEAILGPVRPYIFPLGFAPRTAMHHALTFGVGLFWWWTALSALAIGWYVIRRARSQTKNTKSETRTAWLVCAITVIVYLVLLYGSWTITDNPNPSAVTIGSSYLRYWIPIFVFSTIPVAWALRTAWKTGKAGRILVMALLFAYPLISGFVIMHSPEEGIDAIRKELIRGDSLVHVVRQHTEPNAVIIVDRSDKYIYPERSIIRPLRDEYTYNAIPELIDRFPLYYVGITLPETDIAWLNTVKLPPLGAQMLHKETIGDESLYAIIPYSGNTHDDKDTE